MAGIKKCGICTKPIAGQYASVNGKWYHAHCFICQVCKGDLSKGFFEHENQLLCESCFQNKTCPKCYACKLPIASGKKATVLQHEYHADCLVCQDCKNKLHGHQAYPVKGKIYCSDCHFARKLEAEGMK